MGIENVKDRWVAIITETGVCSKEGASLIVDALVEKAPVKMVECPRCGNQDIVTERQCYKCQPAHFWTED